jgi:tetratricopeptide (TPR) repeat protein
MKVQCRYPGMMSILFLLCGLSNVWNSIAAAETTTGRDIQQRLQAALEQQHQHSSEPAFLVRLADLYLDLGDDALSEQSKRAAYEEGAKLARHAIDLQETNAHAHYLYAANLGSAAHLKGMMASALTIQELKRHVKRALELDPHHAAALHMMGMMLEELPWVLGGDAKGALTYLQRAVEADPNYALARIDLAKAYIKRKDLGSARKELGIILQQPLSPDASASDHRHREEALQLHHSLGAP